MRINCLHIIMLLSLIGLLGSCVGDSGFSDIPEINFVAVSKDTLIQGNLLNDSLNLVFGFRDGNGDIGISETFNRNIRLIDSRTNEVLTTFKTPQLPEAGANGGIEGTITLKVFTQCCLFDGNPDLIPCASSQEFSSEQFQIDIELTDDSGNVSNTVTSSFITLLCD